MAFGDEDLDQIYSADDPFCVEAVFTISVNTDLAVFGKFWDATEAVSIYSGQPEVNDAAFECRTDQVADVRNEMTVTIESVDYTVKKVQKLGTGISLVVLKT